MKVSIIDIFEMAYNRINGELTNIKPGHNGPYMDPETLCRNYSHWLIIAMTLYRETNNENYYLFAQKIISELKGCLFRPMAASFHCRSNPNKDFSNGLMGQAWVMEALLFSYEILEDKSLLQLAEEIYFKHFFDKKRGIWRILNVDGSYSDFDKTFNHQLWFAAIASQIPRDSIKDDIKLFFNNVIRNIEVYSDGVIYHKSSIFKFSIESKLGVLSLVNFLIDSFFNMKSKSGLYSKSVGYHSFNLYAFSILQDSFLDDSFFTSEKFKKIGNVIFSKEYQKTLQKSKYSFQYNPPGYEEAVFLSRQPTVKDNYDSVLNTIQRNFNITGKYNIKGVHDEHTSFARLYELARLSIDLNRKFITVDE
ncbi:MULTISPECIES: hypothetical protein [Pseudoalteromonas]|uniref:hypothetical protein n=1 Tax=Pseudoalteromonas TaxID=53246 RepID=UPI0002D6F5B0|nr:MULTISPECIES: hypothetical protein [Pseudoalteromonas]MCF6145992.1 hypothetical protein [Pseudoalteromonas mariniglutinosa NCIMB 1770]